MESMKFTEGPWEIVPNGYIRTPFDGKNGGFIIADFTTSHLSEKQENMALINTSPKMFWLLMDIYQASEDERFRNGIKEVLEEASGKPICELMGY